jgi:hypothetical protein
LDNQFFSIVEDGRKNNGGARDNSGRKSKSDEQNLIERLSPMEDSAHQALRDNVEAGEAWAIKLYFEYMYGKPKQSVDHTTGGDKLHIPVSKWL